jgi:hypothetical protein
MISRLLSSARYTFANVWASTPCIITSDSFYYLGEDVTEDGDNI